MMGQDDPRSCMQALAYDGAGSFRSSRAPGTKCMQAHAYDAAEGDALLRKRARGSISERDNCVHSQTWLATSSGHSALLAQTWSCSKAVVQVCCKLSCERV